MKKILIIEDEAVLLKMAVKAFTEKEYSVLQATNGKEGLKLALSEHPDFILLDIIMPLSDGLETLKALRKDDWGKDANVALMSNLSDDKNLHQALAEGVKHYFIKADWEISDIVNKVDELLS